MSFNFFYKRKANVIREFRQKSVSQLNGIDCLEVSFCVDCNNCVVIILIFTKFFTFTETKKCSFFFKVNFIYFKNTAKDNVREKQQKEREKTRDQRKGRERERERKREKEIERERTREAGEVKKINDFVKGFSKWGFS